MTDDMEFDNVYGKVKQVVAEVFSTDESELTMETSIIDDLGAESLDIITLLMEFEDMFDQKIPDEDVQKFLTIGDIVKYIMNLAGKTS